MGEGLKRGNGYPFQEELAGEERPVERPDAECGTGGRALSRPASEQPGSAEANGRANGRPGSGGGGGRARGGPGRGGAVSGGPGSGRAGSGRPGSGGAVSRGPG